MTFIRILAAAALAAPLCACISPHQEDAKLRMPWPAGSEPGLIAYAEPKADYPTVGGDILKGTAPQPIIPPAPETPPTP
ncbi:MAG TPA: hypothetical protein VFE03_10310 [Caulobacteraceae bacterium]|jgi:hypothetical protein|nr:hypothetical protein [Caulobacteraceae bacterium]